MSISEELFFCFKEHGDLSFCFFACYGIWLSPHRPQSSRRFLHASINCFYKLLFVHVFATFGCKVTTKK